MAASKEHSTTKHNNTKVRRSQAPTGGDLFAPRNGQDDLDCRNRAPYPCQPDQASPNAYADTSQPGSPRSPHEGHEQARPSLSSDAERAGGQFDCASAQADVSESEPSEAGRLAAGGDRPSHATVPQFCPVMTVKEVAR